MDETIGLIYSHPDCSTDLIESSRRKGETEKRRMTNFIFSQCIYCFSIDPKMVNTRSDKWTLSEGHRIFLFSRFFQEQIQFVLSLSSVGGLGGLKILLAETKKNSRHA